MPEKETAASECRCRIREDLLRLGVRPGGPLLVHSSFRSLGAVPGGIQTLIDALADALGPEGTLLMPALSWSSVDRRNPVFDARHTPSCVGAVPECFRLQEGTLRSMHPTHSMCGRGPLVQVLFRNHADDTTPCGVNSPFARLRFHGGQILMLGCGLLPNTSMHAAEECAGAPYLFETEPVVYTLTGFDGNTAEAVHRRHASFPQHYDRIKPRLLGHGLVEGRVLEAKCHLMDVGALWDCATGMLGEDILCFTRD